MLNMAHSTEKLYCVWYIDNFWSFEALYHNLGDVGGQYFIAGRRHYIYTVILFIVLWAIEVRNRKWPIRSCNLSPHKAKDISASATWWELDK